MGNLQEFLKVKRDDIEKGGFAIVTDEKIPMNCIYFVGSGAESAKVYWNYELATGLGEMVAETIEFLQRKKRIQVTGLAVNPDFESILQNAISQFADPDMLAQVVDDFYE